MLRSSVVRRARRPVAGLTCLLFLALPGCYSYSPVERGAPEAGSEVRLHLDEEGAERMVRQTFLTRGEVVEGRIVELRDSELRMVVSRAARRNFVAGGRDRDTVGVPRSGIATVELKQMETAKTAALIGGVTAGSVLLSIAALNAAGGGGAPDGGNGGETFSISIPVSIP